MIKYKNAQISPWSFYEDPLLKSKAPNQKQCDKDQQKIEVQEKKITKASPDKKNAKRRSIFERSSQHRQAVLRSRTDIQKQGEEKLRLMQQILMRSKNNQRSKKPYKEQMTMKVARLSEIQPSQILDGMYKNTRELLIKSFMLKMVKQKISEQVHSLGQSILHPPLFLSDKSSGVYLKERDQLYSKSTLPYLSPNKNSISSVRPSHLQEMLMVADEENHRSRLKRSLSEVSSKLQEEKIGITLLSPQKKSPRKKYVISHSKNVVDSAAILQNYGSIMGDSSCLEIS